MSRYIIQFYKQQNMKYISHLDLMRLFKRSFKRVGIQLIHSQGFNPHPKMSFVQPLSLGYSSMSEYLDFETTEPAIPGEIMERLSGVLPAGIGVMACRQLAPGKKTLAAIVEYAAYSIEMTTGEDIQWADQIQPFLAQSEIVVEKKQKKSGNMVSQNIRPMIFQMEKEVLPMEEIEDMVDHNSIRLTVRISAGSNCNLNPEVLLASFCQFCGIAYCAQEVCVERKELFYKNTVTKAMVPILQYEP